MDTAKQIDAATEACALGNIRAIRAANRADALTSHAIGLVQGAMDRDALNRNMLERLQIFADILRVKDGRMPAGWQEDFAARTVAMCLSALRGQR